MKKTPIFSLLIATRNRKNELIRTLTVMSPHLLPNHEIIVFDDGSTDGTADEVVKLFPGVQVLRNDRQIGYIAARNILINKANGIYAISLDDDLEIITPDFIPLIDNYFKQNSRCAVSAFRIYWGTEPPGNTVDFETKSGRVRSFVGGGNAIRLEAWRLTSRYPEWFEFYGEEDYASMQLLRNGWEIHYFPQILAHHRVKVLDRSAADKSWRYRTQLRAGIYNMLLFYPWYILPRRVVYAFWMQIRLRLLKEHNWSVARQLIWVLKELLKNSIKIYKERKPLNKEQWNVWDNLPPAAIYWSPDK